MNHQPKQHSKKAGLPPGTLVYTGNHPEPTKVVLYRFDQETIESFQGIEAVSQINPKKVNWFNITGFSDTSLIGEIGEKFGLHPLMLEDILNSDHLPNVEDMDDCLFITLKVISLKLNANELDVHHASFVVGKHYLLSFSETDNQLFQPVIERLENNKGKARMNKADYLSYLLIDKIVDNYYLVLDHLEEHMDKIEAKLLNDPSPRLAGEIMTQKKLLIMLRKSVNPFRDEVRKITREESTFITQNTLRYLNDVYDHLNQIVQTIDNFREMISDMMDLLMANNANRMNSIITTLTMISSIFIPLTFIVGIYGMNFEYFPEIKWHYGYPLIMLIMLMIGVGMYIYMRRKRWL
ncbi:MAG: magnesium/cobalt transporter CorA [Bacteroidota bacterium]